MKFKISSDTLIDVISKLGKLLTVRGLLDWQDSIRFEFNTNDKKSMTCISTGKDMWYRKTIQIDEVVSVSKPTKFLIDAKKLAEITKDIGKGREIDVSIDDSFKATIKSGSSVYKINCQDISEYPSFEGKFDNDDILGEITNQQMKKLNSVGFAADGGNSLATMNTQGVCIEFHKDKIRAVATDTGVLALIEMKADNKIVADKPTEVILPETTLSFIESLTDEDFVVGIKRDRSGDVFKVVFISDTSEIASPVMVGKYAPYATIILKNYSWFMSAEMDTFSAAVARCGIVKSSLDFANSVVLEISEKGSVVFNEEAESGQRVESSIVSNANIDRLCVFNHKYLQQCLKFLNWKNGLELIIYGKHDITNLQDGKTISSRPLPAIITTIEVEAGVTRFVMLGGVNSTKYFNKLGQVNYEGDLKEIDVFNLGKNKAPATPNIAPSNANSSQPSSRPRVTRPAAAFAQNVVQQPQPVNTTSRRGRR